MELIKDVANFIATGLGDLIATLLPYAFIGMVGLAFVLCGRSRTDARYPKYPPLPVLRCKGYEEIRPEDRAPLPDAPPNL